MKYIILCAVSLFIAAASWGQAIPIDSFFTPGTTWLQATYYDRHTGSSWSRSWGAYGMLFRIERDSIISGTKYHLLSVTNKCNYNYYWLHYPPATFSINNYPYYKGIIGRIRVDSSKVYFTRDINTLDYDYSGYLLGVEYLLYDFSLTSGSFLSSAHPGYNFLVASVDSVSAELSTGYHIKKYSDTNGRYWLEGIGSSSGLISYASLTTGPGNYGITDEKLLCYDNPSFSYHVSYTDSIMPGNLQHTCFNVMALGTPTTPTEKNGLTVYPNPALNKSITCTVSTAINELTQLDIKNTLGQVLYTGSIATNTPADITLDVPPGIYFITAQTATGKMFSMITVE